MRHENILQTDITILSHRRGTKFSSREDVTNAFPDLFDGALGKFAGRAHFELDNSVPPVKLPLRKIPLAMKPDLAAELERLENLGVIEREEQPTDWVSSLVVARKANGDIRVCIDPKPLNKALKRAQYPMPTLEDLLPRLKKARVFNVCDVSSGYWHVELDEASSRLTTFATPTGRFRWTRLPFGLSVAPEIFQSCMDAAIGGLQGVGTIVDDMLVWGEGDTDEEATFDHDHNLERLLERCRQRGLKLNAKKAPFPTAKSRICRTHLVSGRTWK